MKYFLGHITSRGNYPRIILLTNKVIQELFTTWGWSKVDIRITLPFRSVFHNIDPLLKFS